MQQLLDSADQQNRAFIPFTSDSALTRAVRFYDTYGTHNERMRAHYLLGCVYRDLGEAPQALQCYHDAADCADTTAADCDYRLLCRVHGQIADVYMQVRLLDDALDEMRLASKIAMQAGDTLASIVLFERQYIVYDMQKRYDAAISVAIQSMKQYSKYGYEWNANATNGMLATFYVRTGKYEEARQAFEIYEKSSGFFDNDGNIENGREIYYYAKGEYYLGINEQDSAEIYFRRILPFTQDLNLQEAAHHGLYQLYFQKNQTDSASKYAELSYEICDQRILETSTEEVSRMKSLYNYGRSQRIAMTEQAKSMRMRQWLFLSVCAVVIITIFAALFIRHMLEKRKAEKRHYQSRLMRYAQEQAELQHLQKQHYERLVNEKRQVIEILRRDIQHYQELQPRHFADAVDELIIGSEICQSFHRYAEKGNHQPNRNEWKDLALYVNEIIPRYSAFVDKMTPPLRTEEKQVCLLIRLQFSPFEICNLTGLSSSTISMMRKRMLFKLFGKQGTPKDFDRHIRNVI